MSEHEACPIVRAVCGTLSLQGLSGLSFAFLASFSMPEEHSAHCLCLVWLFFLAIS